MSKRIFINNLNTFVSKQLLAELRNDEPNEEGEVAGDANTIFGTYIDRDSSEKPAGVKKMLKVCYFLSTYFVTFLFSNLYRDPSQDWQ